MKTTVFRILGLFLAIMPVTVTAQTNIKSAFDAIINCRDAEITEKHTLDKDPETNVKTGQSDVYSFTLPANKINLVKNVITAFDKDREVAYSLNQGKATNSDSDIRLAVGEDTGSGVYVNEPNSDYIYALFLAPKSEDPEGIFRYAYAINYREKGDKIVGKLIVTYATTLKYRQEVEKERQMNIFRSYSNGTSVFASQQSWFEQLMTYFQNMTSANSQTRIALATKAYKVIRDTSSYPDVTEGDKDAIREILKGMISDKKYSETVLNNLLNQCLIGIK